MGWRGALRTFGAIAREAERNARRQARAQGQYLAAVEKAEQREKATRAVTDLEEYLQRIVTLHVECSPTIDWPQCAQLPAPTYPPVVTEREQAAAARLTAYTPSFWDRLLRRVEVARSRRHAAVAHARYEDQMDTQRRVQAYQSALTNHQDAMELAEKILEGDREAMIEVLRQADAITSIGLLGDSLQFQIASGRSVAVALNVHGAHVVPKQTARLLATGKASLKDMPKSQYYRLYQDHVCSAALRVAREVCAILPVDDVTVSAVDELLDTATGQLTVQAILSFVAPRATLARLNFAGIDPSDAMVNFNHRMQFKAMSGFEPIESLFPLQ